MYINLGCLIQKRTQLEINYNLLELNYQPNKGVLNDSNALSENNVVGPIMHSETEASEAFMSKDNYYNYYNYNYCDN